MEKETADLFENVDILRKNLDYMPAEELKKKHRAAYLQKLERIKEQLILYMQGMLKGFQINPEDTMEIKKIQTIVDARIPFLQESAFATADSGTLKQQLTELSEAIKTEYVTYQMALLENQETMQVLRCIREQL